MVCPNLAVIGHHLIRFGHEEFGKGFERLVRIIKKPNQRQARVGPSLIIIEKKKMHKEVTWEFLSYRKKVGFCVIWSDIPPLLVPSSCAKGCCTIKHRKSLFFKEGQNHDVWLGLELNGTQEKTGCTRVDKAICISRSPK